MRNYAIPDHGACPDDRDIGALVRYFRRHQRIPRLEYVEDSSPRTWPALARAGFTLEQRTPVMIATPDTRLTPRPTAGTGLVEVPGDRPAVGELAAVGVLPAFRRRGIASAISAYLARTAHAQGIGLVFLEAEPDGEQIYRRCGFIDATTKIWVSLR